MSRTESIAKRRSDSEFERELRVIERTHAAVNPPDFPEVLRVIRVNAHLAHNANHEQYMALARLAAAAIRGMEMISSIQTRRKYDDECPGDCQVS